MGQGQEYHARKMMTECMSSGTVFLIKTKKPIRSY